MDVTRIDLDGAGSPAALVTKILKAEPGLTAPVPIDALALQLDIAEIREVSTDGFEGGLITDSSRSKGFILVNREARRGRRRFTVGHELGHFLMTHHKPPPDGFRCSREDMRRWSDRDQDAGVRMEVEANQFAALILMPPPLWRAATANYQEPDLSQILQLARDFDVSKEAAARTYAHYHDEPIAVVVAKDGRINRVYRNPVKFPKLCVSNGSSVPALSALFRENRQLDRPSQILDARAEQWLETDWGKPIPALYEQVYFQQDGYALIMLLCDLADAEVEESDPEEDMTAKQRYEHRRTSWRGRS